MGHKIIFEGNEYKLHKWYFSHLIATDNFGNKLFVKHSQNKNNIFYQILNILTLNLINYSK
jgi:hypothetical protein